MNGKNHPQRESIPNGLLSKLFDATGTPNGGNKGFILAYINERGEAIVSSRTEFSHIGLSLSKALQFAIKDFNNGGPNLQ